MTDLIVIDLAVQILSCVVAAAGLLAEQLNSVSYKARAAIAETLPSMGGVLSRDIVRKLIDIMWCACRSPRIAPFQLHFKIT